LAKAEQYRLLNQPKLAESICLDVLDVDKNNHKAKVFLLLRSNRPVLANHLVQRSMRMNWRRVYKTSTRNFITPQLFVSEWAPHTKSGNRGQNFDAYEWYMEAMELFEKSQPLAPPYNNDAILRWNTCARTIMQYDFTGASIENSAAGIIVLDKIR